MTIRRDVAMTRRVLPTRLDLRHLPSDSQWGDLAQTFVPLGRVQQLGAIASIGAGRSGLCAQTEGEVKYG